MADSTTNVPQILTAQSGKEITANIDFNMASPAMLYAIWKIIGQTCHGLGGKVFIAGVPTNINNWTLTLTFSATNYIRKLDSTGAVSFVTSIPTSWPAANGGYTPLHTVVMGAATFTSWVDHRVGFVDSSGGSGGAPSGAAGGHLGGTYPNPTLSATGITAAQALTEAPADLAYTGITVSMTYGESIVAGAPVYFDSTGVVLKADANAAGKFPALGMAMETAASGSHVVLLHGIYRNDALYALTVGGLLYLSTTAGALTQTQPSATDECIQVLGVATHADRIYFAPQLDYITHV